MKPILLVDFGSTNTKVTAVDVETMRFLEQQQHIQPWKQILTTVFGKQFLIWKR